MKPIHKFNNGNGATLCNACHVIINTGLTEAVLCEECNTQHIYMSRIFDSEQKVLEAVKEIAEERIAETEITPKALLDLGFEEVYQGVDLGEPGYIFYSLEIKGVGFYTSSTEEGEMWVKLDNSDFDIRSLRKLGDLITALNELS